jgi:hypothetical protein
MQIGMGSRIEDPWASRIEANDRLPQRNPCAPGSGIHERWSDGIIDRGRVYKTIQQHQPAQLERVLRLGLDLGLFVRCDLRFLNGLLFSNLLNRRRELCGRRRASLGTVEIRDLLPQRRQLSPQLLKFMLRSLEFPLSSAHGIGQLLNLPGKLIAVLRLSVHKRE